MKNTLFRKAGKKIWPLIQKSADDIFQTVKPDVSDAAGVVNTMVRYGPDLIWPLIMMNGLPEGTPMSDRLKVYVQDLGLNLLGSVGGQYGGAKLGGLAVRSGAPQSVATGLQTFGDLAAGMGQAQIPRPTFMKVLEESGLEQQQVREAEIRQEEQQRMEDVLNALLAGGAITGSAVGYPGVKKAV